MSVDAYQRIIQLVEQSTLDEQQKFIEIIKQVVQLTPDEQQKLIEEMIAMSHLPKTRRPKHSIIELQGLGKEIWEGVDPQEYIEKERNSWDDNLR